MECKGARVASCCPQILTTDIKLKFKICLTNISRARLLKTPPSLEQHKENLFIPTILYFMQRTKVFNKTEAPWSEVTASRCTRQLRDSK